MKTTIERLLRKHFSLNGKDWQKQVPANTISRQAWQEAVETVVEAVRGNDDCPVLMLQASEISVCYHKPVGNFVRLVVQKTRKN